MKQMKFFLVSLAILMSATFTSCIDKDNESSYDVIVNATVVNDITEVYLLGDDGEIYYPNNSSILKNTTTNEYPARIFAYLKYLNGVTSESNKKEVTIVNGRTLYTRSLCTRPDTIKNDIPLGGLTDFGLLNVKSTYTRTIPAYCNILFKVYLDNSAAVLDLVPVSASENELTVKLQQTIGNKNAGSLTEGYASFEIPSISEINEALERVADMKEEEPTVLTPQGNKIKIKVIAQGSNTTFKLDAKEVTIHPY